MPKRPQNPAGLAAAAYADGRREEARTLAQAAVKENPGDFEALTILGYASFHLGKFADSAAALERAVELDPNTLDRRLPLAATYRELGRIGAALAILTGVIERDPDNVPALLELAALQWTRGKFAEATGAYERALKLEPRSAPIHASLASALLDQGKWPEALTSARTAHDLDPASADFALLLGQIHLLLGDAESALEKCQAALDREPDALAALTLMGRIQATRGDLEAAIDSQRRVTGLAGENSSSHVSLGHVLRMAGRAKQALASYDRALEIDTGCAEAYLGRASLILNGRGAPDDAADALGARVVRIRDGVKLALPSPISLSATFVFLEQEDWLEDEKDFLRRFLEPGMTVVDIGANMGFYSLLAAQRVGTDGAVWAFEPGRMAAHFLDRNRELNNAANLHVEGIALSDSDGRAVFQVPLADGLDFAGLKGVPGPEYDTVSDEVETATLDSCRARFGWTAVDFIKIDAEGAEASIIDGAGRTLDEFSPLIMFEVRSSDQGVDTKSMEKLREKGLNLYRLAPGPNLLVPFSYDADRTGYLLNLFACAGPREDELSRRGLLARSGSENPPAEPPVTGAWRELFSEYPFLRVLGDDAADEAAERALDFYAAAHSPGLDAGLRLACLKACADLVQAPAGEGADLERLSTLARVEWELGDRPMALEALMSAINAGESGGWPKRPARPFLPPSPRFDAIDPGTEFGTWLMTGMVEQLLRLSNFSAFFVRENNLALRNERRWLDRIKDSPFRSYEATRRRQLLCLAEGIPCDPADVERLCEEAADNLNPDFWRSVRDPLP